MKRIIKISIITLPASILSFLLIDVFMSVIIGGIATIKGFPIPYYHDVLITPKIDFYYPIIMYLDIALIYIVTTFVVFKLFQNRF